METAQLKERQLEQRYISIGNNNTPRPTLWLTMVYDEKLGNISKIIPTDEFYSLDLDTQRDILGTRWDIKEAINYNH